MSDNTSAAMPFSLNPSGSAQLSGPLTLETVAATYRLAEAAASQGQFISDVDLEKVTRVDSSGLALLLEWKSVAGRNGRALNIRNAPADLLSLASLCEAAGLLAIDRKVPTRETATSESSPNQS
jgi:phospholipid transport system transporter-binding protein